MAFMQCEYLSRRIVPPFESLQVVELTELLEDLAEDDVPCPALLDEEVLPPGVPVEKQLPPVPGLLRESYSSPDICRCPPVQHSLLQTPAHPPLKSPLRHTLALAK